MSPHTAVAGNHWRTRCGGTPHAIGNDGFGCNTDRPIAQGVAVHVVIAIAVDKRGVGAVGSRHAPPCNEVSLAQGYLPRTERAREPFESDGPAAAIEHSIVDASHQFRKLAEGRHS